MEQSLSSLTYKGSIPAAIAEAKKQRKLFVVYISGEDAETSRLDNTTWTDSKVAESVLKYCILLHLYEGNNDATQFSAIYPQKSIPSITAVGYNGVQLWQNEGFISPEVLASSLEKVWLSLHIQDTTVSVLSAALASKTSEPSTSGVSTTASSDQGSSDVIGQSPLTETYDKSQNATTEVSSEKANEHKNDLGTVQEKNCEFGGKTCSRSVDSDGVECASNEKANSSIEATKELPGSAVLDLNNGGATDGSNSPDKIVDCELVVSGGGSKSMNKEVDHLVVEYSKDEAEAETDRTVDNCVTIKKSSDAYLNIRLPDGVNLQEKFSVTSTLSMVKDYVNEHHESAIGSYDLAIPYPRKVYTDQDLSRTLSELGLFDRQALIMVPRQRASEQSNSRNIADYSNESTDGYFNYVKRFFSFINPLSYLGGGSSSTSSGQQSQHGMWEYGTNSVRQNNFTQEQRSQNISSGSRNGKTKRPVMSGYGSNIHTLKHDEDDGRFNDRNSFWNGNSTQYGGNDNEK